MPAKRLPWFRVWIDATTHAKVRKLDDGTFRTWVELLDAAAQQVKRGRFANRAEAVAITRRPPKHVAALIDAKLIDETPEELTMHDWDEWQRWRPEDGNDYGMPPDHPPNDNGKHSRTTRERLANDSRITTEALTNDHSTHAHVRVPASGDADTETDTDTELTPSAPSEHLPAEGRQRKTVIDDAFKAELEDQFWEQFGSREAVQDSIAAALGYKKRSNYTDQRAFLRNWVRGDAERAQTRRGGKRPAPINDSAREDMARKFAHLGATA